MRNIKLCIEYDGTRYAGWQQQDGQISVQETLKNAIEKIVLEKITLLGAGRTDAGVHALRQIANFKTSSQIPANQLLFAINSQLPKDIAIIETSDVDDNFHSRYSAKWKVYRYTVYNSKVRSALNRNFACAYNFPLNLDEMRKGAELLIGEHDFSSFKTGAIKGENNSRFLKRLEIERNGEYFYFTFEGSGFLRYMVRRVVGALLELGRGKITLEYLKIIIDAKDPKIRGGSTAPAMGLCLMEVKY